MSWRSRSRRLLLLALQRGDVGADRNVAAVLGAALVDLQPAAVARAAPRSVRAPASLPVVAHELVLHDRRRRASDASPLVGRARRDARPA